MPLAHEQFLELLSEFESLPKKIRSESIFDIAGYPHYENVASNILAFFLNPNNEHGLGQLMLNSLLDLAQVRETNHSNVQVRREVSTQNNGRLDIVIETDNQLIGIENKIFHHLANDLKDYSDSLNLWAKPNNLSTVKIILGIRKETESFDFVSITYEELFSRVKSLLGSYVNTSSQKWLLYLIDFITTIERLKGGDMELDESDIFFIENQERVDSLINARSRFLSKLSSKVSTLKNEIEIPATCEKQWIYAKDCLVHDFNLSGHSIAFDLYISPIGWELQLFERINQPSDYLTDIVSTRRDMITIEGKRYILEKWPLSTELNEIKEKLCEWMSWIIQEDRKKSLNNDATQ